MQRSLKPVTWFLLFIIVALPVVAQASAAEMTPQSAGCDEHGGTGPSHPASFVCCQNGHDSAVVQKVFSFDRSICQITLLSNFLPDGSLAGPSVTLLPASSSSPPFLFSLRV
jgi:hypothetical protein